MTRTLPLLLTCALLALTACKEEVVQDTAPQEMTAETLGHYCQMNLLEHPGPKAQVHLDGLPGRPLFFSQVRDAIAYARAPEQMAPILAIWVNDMGAPGASWDAPGTWIAADTAWYVVGSARQGGMGAPETVPFATRAAAEAFAAREGGGVMRLSEITTDMVLTPVDSSASDDDFLRRLKTLSHPAGG